LQEQIQTGAIDKTVFRMNNK